MLLYSLFPLKYAERQGSKDLGENLWNEGRTEEITHRVLHIGTE